jgi:hypothetical protein
VNLLVLPLGLLLELVIIDPKLLHEVLEELQTLFLSMHTV